jgi:hypothetical protein
MSTRIAYPGPARTVDDTQIERWYFGALDAGLVPPAKTLGEMTEALDNAGIIRLAHKQPE